jgi:hypothetical protein
VPDNSIVELMMVSTGERDLAWLQRSLQSAVELEFATLPVYLMGMWSIREQEGEAYRLIKSVLMEEMLHMGLVCNMIVAIGGTPRIVAPVYPGPVPGGVLPGLEVYLAGLCPETLDLYMSIEKPEDPVEPPDFATRAEEYATIGLFYDAIRDAFRTLAPLLCPDRQIAGREPIPVPDPNHPTNTIPEPLTVLTTLDDVAKAIETIKEQGEGTSSESPLHAGELGHYYRFGEIRHGRRFVEVEGGWDYVGDPVPFPDCHPVVRVPAGGYPDLPAQKEFNTLYAQLIAQLQSAWSDGGPPALGQAITTMRSMDDLAKPIIETPLPYGGGNYGPDFIPVPAPPPPAGAAG